MDLCRANVALTTQPPQACKIALEVYQGVFERMWLKRAYVWVSRVEQVRFARGSRRRKRRIVHALHALACRKDRQRESRKGPAGARHQARQRSLFVDREIGKTICAVDRDWRD